ncbi:metallophosphoesterase [Rhodococcoides trifolii]|uniref:Metallophosphoesterase n=1 Tax=Rhodococcoides trifolii TaxID=908250 RepID=A0A917CTK9_9NOCA|nr:metallophosphoesterase [Rhodococcus trifolii]GGF98410.1 metallophosphoesterase [Rhodococcus trifolii]
MRRLIVLLVLLILFGVPWWTLFFWGSDWPTAVQVLGTLGTLAAAGVLLVGMRLGHMQHKDWAARVGDSLLGLVWIVFVWSVLSLVLRLALLGLDEPNRSRIVASAVAITTIALAAWGHYEAMRVPRVKKQTIDIDGLSRDLRIVLITDTHYGPINREKWSRRTIEKVNTLDADVVCHVGDIADGSVLQRRNQAAPLEKVRAKSARVYVTGNHEYFGEAQEWLDHMESLGWDSLHNRHITIDGTLVIAGVDDRTAKGPGHGPDLEKALKNADPDLPVFLLAHQPKQIAQAVGKVDLQVSGHTHGGQIWPFNFLVRIDQPVVHGLSRHGERTQLYTSRGSGFWGPPFRVFAPSEITLLTLRSPQY